MAGSTFGNCFKVMTWGESHGTGIGVVIDGCPAGLAICEEGIQAYLDRRKPGSNPYGTPRREGDKVTILSGVMEGRTTGTPISLVVYNENQRSADYAEIASYYRPGHADYTYDRKYGFRDYRGGGRSSGRETIGRVAAGAVALEILKQLQIEVNAYVKAIGPIEIDYKNCKKQNILQSPLYMPDLQASERAEQYLQEQMKKKDSAGGIVECIITGVPAGVGEPVFEKLDANLAKAVMSIGAVKGFEIGSGFEAAKLCGSENNDAFFAGKDGMTGKRTNHAGGILGGISDGAEIVFRAAFKPTPSIGREQETMNQNGENITVCVKGRHDPVIVPRAVVVVEAMAAITLTDMLLQNMSSRMDYIKDFYKN